MGIFWIVNSLSLKTNQLTGERDSQRCIDVLSKPHVQLGFFIRRLQLSFTRNKEFESKVAFANESQVVADEPERSKRCLPRHWAKSPLSAGTRAAQSRRMKAFDEDLIQNLVWKCE